MRYQEALEAGEIKDCSNSQLGVAAILVKQGFCLNSKLGKAEFSKAEFSKAVHLNKPVVYQTLAPCWAPVSSRPCESKIIPFAK